MKPGAVPSGGPKRSLQTLCPSCGAQVGFIRGDSVLAVCPYCASTLLRTGDAVENLGRMAELFDDHSPLRLGVQGRVDGRGFALIGRLQVRYPAGTWNEWRILWDDGTAGWLSEDNGHAVLLDDGVPPAAAEALAREAGWPVFDALRLDQPFAAGGIVWRVVNKVSATIVAGEGELPFRIGPGLPVRVADLRGPAGEFATLDYPAEAARTATGGQAGEPGAAAAAPAFYRGRAVRLVDLALSGLRTELTRQVATEAFACPACGAPVSAALPTTRTLSCPSCQAVVDISQGSGARIEYWRQQGKAPKPQLPLQSTGRFDGGQWTVVGFQRRRASFDGEVFHWDEYLLFEPMRGFRFLVCDQGHWSWVEVLQRSVTRTRDARGRGVVMLGGRRFDQYSRYQSEAVWILGEFYWRITAGDRCRHEDYIAPPAMLSCETTDDEITWSEGRYLTPAEVGAAFGRQPPLPVPKSLGTIQPAPRSWRRAHALLAAVILGALVLLQAVLWLRGSDLELTAARPLPIGAAAFEDSLIEVRGSQDANLVIRTDANVTNQAFDIEVEVASREVRPGGAGPAPRQWAGSAELGFYEGRDADGAWSEGSRSERIVFKVAPGPYLVRIRAGPASPPAAGQPPSASYSIAQRSRPGWLPFVVALGVLGILNLVGVLGCPDPEAGRWADSDYGTRPGRAPAAS